MNILEKIKNELRENAKQEKASVYAGFFKTGSGEYAEGDIFIGVTIPEIRKIAKRYYKDIAYPEIISLLQSNIHEYKLLSLFLLIHNYEKADDENGKKEVLDFYIKNIEHVNNWDLVDMSGDRKSVV